MISHRRRDEYEQLLVVCITAQVALKGGSSAAADEYKRLTHNPIAGLWELDRIGHDLPYLLCQHPRDDAQCH